MQGNQNTDNCKRKWPKGALAALLLMAALVLAANNWIIAQLKETRPDPPGAEGPGLVLPPEPDGGPAVQDEPVVYGEVSRVTQLDPNRAYDNNIIYVEGQKVAAFKSNGFKIFDLEGRIPNGKIKFVDSSRSTNGEEYFRNNQRHGIYQEFYSSGEVRKEALFEYGQMVQLQEFFIDGKPRMEIDYRDALAGLADGETGIGRVYYRDGTLRYEWNLTNQGQQRYKRAFNVAGKMVQEKIYDVKGDLVKTTDY